jgi:hypothetical protein
MAEFDTSENHVYDQGGNLIAVETIANDPREARRARLEKLAREAVDTLEQADANWDTLTAAQRTAAMRLAVRVVAKLARLYLNSLEKE